MSTITVPLKNTGDLFTATELNQIIDALRSGTFDIAAANITSNSQDVVTADVLTSKLDANMGHTFTVGSSDSKDHPEALTIGGGTEAMFSIGTILNQDEKRTDGQLTSYWDNTTNKVIPSSLIGNGMIKIAFSIETEKRDSEISCRVLLNDGVDDLLIHNEARRTSRERNIEHRVSFNIPVFLNQISASNGFEIYISNDETNQVGSDIYIYNPSVYFFQYGGR